MKKMPERIESEKAYSNRTLLATVCLFSFLSLLS